MRIAGHLAALGVASMALGGCAHRSPNVKRYVQGRPPEYQTPAVKAAGAPVSTGRAAELEEPVPAASREPNAPAEDRKEAAAQPLHQRVPRAKQSASVPTLEASRPGLAAALAQLSVEESAAHHHEAAREYMRAGVADTAMKHLDSALRHDRADAVAYDLRARLWRDGGLPSHGLGDAYRAVHLAPDSASAHNTLGTLFHRLRRYAAARREYEHALALAPGAPYVLNNLCTLAADERRMPDAEEVCRRALAADPASQLPRRNLARLSALSAAGAGGEHGRH